MLFALRLVLLLGLFLTEQVALAQLELRADAKELAITSGLTIDRVSQWSRRAINIDAIAALVVAGKLGDPAWGSPKAGETVDLPTLLAARNAPTTGEGNDGEVEKAAQEKANPTRTRAWREIAANEKGEFVGSRSDSYILTHVQSEKSRVMVLEAKGHSMVYENGVPRAGDPYSSGFLKLPVMLREGDNILLFVHAGRGPLTARLVEPRAELMVLTEDVTAPDIVRGKRDSYSLSIPVLNTGLKKKSAMITIHGDHVGKATFIVEFVLEPLSVRKISVLVDADPGEAEKFDARIRLTEVSAPGEEARAKVIDEQPLTMQVVAPKATRKITFDSELDRSTQYYGVVPAKVPAATNEGVRPGMVLSLHGADVHAIGQARAYAAKSDLVIVCPTNRRHFGFDWEDWGRVDAMEVLRHAAKEFDTDPERQYLTGHSMGGHGTWQLGVHYPDRFAAIAPSAGWPSFETYMGSMGRSLKLPGESPHSVVFQRAASSSDTVALLGNLRGKPIYVLHGDADDNVPVGQARLAKAKLEELKIPLEYHEQPGAGHWWGNEESAAACMDWPPIFEMFARERLTHPPARDASLVTPLLDEISLPRGSFKRAFSRGFTFVYGTKGTREECFQSFAKARYDAEQWWYRGNGGAEVVSDVIALRHAGEHNIILYGSAEVNAAWSLVDENVEIAMHRGRASIGKKTWTGDDLGVLAVAPMKNAPGFLVGIVAGTGLPGSRALDRLPYFSAGAGFPELIVLRSSVWTEGMAGVEFASMPSVSSEASKP